MPARPGFCRRLLLTAFFFFFGTNNLYPLPGKQVLTLGSVLVAFSLVKALAARAPRLLFAWHLPIALEVRERVPKRMGACMTAVSS